MSTKADLADQINESLGISLDSLERMTKEDLEALLKFVSDPSNLIRVGWKNLRYKAKREILQEIMERPLMEDLLSVEEDEEKRGPLGLGLVPRARSIFRGLLKSEEPG